MASVYEGESWEAFVQSLSENTDSEKLFILAHELKRFFPVIKGYAEISKLKLKDENTSNEEFIVWLEKIAQAASDAEKITDAVAQANRK